ncbi:hypothetical protein EV421DRAFT_1896910 [Armillaria borealis]|uniref:Homeobox domain-containing protein n=1 Tax=Armillaria borealis TaxID=47425 RepID=A0AA39K840_9AGAR|nr:hypothetical protein EV421DRAFT_1896910 [Armillaria borealis]
MSNPKEDRYYGRSRSPPVGDSQGGGFFQTGQGGRTVLPPLSSAFPTSRFPVPVAYSNQYPQQRSSPGRYDYTSQYSSSQWQPNSGASSFDYYETQDNRYGAQHTYPVYSSRTSPMIPDTAVDSRKLPPLNTSPHAGYPSASSTMHGGSHIRSPTASYPVTYNGYPSNASSSYAYGMSMADSANVPMSSHSHSHTVMPDMRSSSPYGRNLSHVPPPSYTPPPVSPTSADDSPTIKKKRKRADAAQLKILNETYARTAFPSTEERLALAKLLDMSARSVQIWFQNKRQSMRQTRQSSSTHQSFAMASQGDPLVDDMAHLSTSGYEGTAPMSGSSYMSRSPPPDAHGSPSHSSSHRRARSQDAVVADQRQMWPRGY